MTKNIKKRYLLCLAFAALTAFQSACRKQESVPLEGITEDLVFDKMDINGDYATEALTNLYTFLPNGFNRIDDAYLDAATDDAVSSKSRSNIEVLSKALQSPTQTIDGVYSDNYVCIRRANKFLSKIDVVPFRETSEPTRQYFKAEARFIRAMCYFELIKRYGGVPLMGDHIFGYDDDLTFPRNSFDECVQYIVNECDAIKDSLRKEPLSATDVGRISEGAAMALKARTLLYAASPLNNPGNDPAKWQSAADAALAVINLNVYALNNANNTTAGGSFVGAFISRSDKEVILAFQRDKNKLLERSQAPVGYTNDVDPSNGLTSPTQDLVNAFPTINGKPITTDIYNATTNKTGYNAADPYTNRDPRLKATVFYNGQLWLGRPVETFEGGKDKPNTGIVQTRTGYYLRKFLPDLSSGTSYALQDHNFIIFRYAEILLDYAEAINEAADAQVNRTAAYTQLIALRKRAGITAGTGSLYGLTANMTQAQMRDAIRLERRLELAFEEHRFWDLRRWKVAETALNTTLHGVTITKASDGTFTYQQNTVGTVTFIAPRMYLYPIPFSELQADPALIQNPGW